VEWAELLDTEPSLHGGAAPDEVAGGPPPPRRISAARASTLCFAALVVIAFPLLLHWGRRGWFTQDDWDFLSARSAGNLDDLFRAHFQHWVTLPILAYRLLWTVFGIRAYAPYQALVVLLHLTAAALLLAVMRRAGVAPWLATIAAAVFVFFGAGAENIFVAFQITFVGSLVFGLTQLLLADHDGPRARRDWLGLLAGFAGLLCSGVAVTMVVVVGIAVLLRRGLRGWRLALFHTAPLAVAYLLWSTLSPAGQNAGNYRTQSPTQVLKFVGIGVEAAFGRLGYVTGVGIALAIVLGAGLFVLFRGRGWRPPFGRLGVPIALLAGALLFLSVTGVLRSGQGALLFLVTGTGPERARDSRYVYVVAAMLVPALALAADALVRLKWQLAIPIVAVLLVGLPGNINLLRTPTVYFANSQATRKTIVALPTFPNADQLRDSSRLLPLEGGRFAAEGLTYRWIVDAAAAGKFPKPSALNPTVRATAILRLFLVPKIVNTPVQCAPAPATLVKVFDRQDTFTLQGGPAYVWYAPVGHAKSAIQLYKSGTYVALAGPLRIRINPAPGARICT
jgi:hypothetical protein